jgi:ribonuclease P protein component
VVPAIAAGRAPATLSGMPDAPARHGQSFPPAMRFHHGGDYGRLFHRQQKAAGRWVVVLVAPSRRQPALPRLGVMISTKAAKTAVRRHQLKRWVRELFRTRLVERLGQHDLVVLFRSDPPADAHAQLDHEILSLLPKALAQQSQPRGRGARGPGRGGGRPGSGGPRPSSPPASPAPPA